jgi:hypothetical protein
MPTSTVNITGGVTGQPLGSEVINKTITSAVSNIISVALASGANTITVVPTTGTSGCIIALPSTNTAVVTLKGVSGDTGIAIGKTTTTVLNWDSTAPPASFVLNSASAQTGLYTTIKFF